MDDVSNRGTSHICNWSLRICTFRRSKLDHMSWYANKAELREYLKEINKDKKVSYTM